MSPRRAPPCPARAAQRGQALIATLLIIVVGGASLFYHMATPKNLQLQADAVTARALAEARDALIGYAASNATRPGTLPCPDTNNDGNQETTCNTAATRIGRLPWKTLGVEELRDGAGERLWYAVSNNFKNATQSGTLNSDTSGDYTVTGITPGTGVIAVVFAPGTALAGQDRVAANQNNVAHYLEGTNAGGTTTLQSAQPDTSFNDTLLLITPDRFFPTIIRRVATQIKPLLASYYTTNGYFPNASTYASTLCNEATSQGRIPLNVYVTVFIFKFGCTSQANFGGGSAFPAWFSANNWHQVIHYAVAPACAGATYNAAACTGMTAPLTVSGHSVPNARALIAITGPGLGTQNRPCSVAADCLDDSANTDLNSAFVNPVNSGTNNDFLLVISP